MKFFISTISQLNFWGYKVYRRLDKIQQVDRHDGLIWRLELKSWVKRRRESSVLSLHPLPCHSFKVLPFYTLVFLFSFVTFLAFWRASYHMSIFYVEEKNKATHAHMNREVFFGILHKPINCTLKLERIAHALCIHCTPVHRLHGWGGCMRCAWPWPWSRRQ